MNKPKKGMTFTHKMFVDQSWKPLPGESWSHDAPNATMVITSVWSTKVYYDYFPSNGRGKFVKDKEDFIKIYGDQL